MKTTPAKRNIPPLPIGAKWLLAALLCAGAAVGLVYHWRVFYYLDARGISATLLTALAAGLALAAVGAAWVCTHLLKNTENRAALCILLCGLLLVFANPPLQAPDEGNHFLRCYAISQGKLDFDAARAYPEDVARLYRSFPGAWVTAHTSQGLTEDENGEEIAYNTAGYALKQYGETGRVESVLDSFDAYFAGEETDPVTEPVLFLVLPFLPQALGMALARLFGLKALGCLYAGRIANLLVYTWLCRLALKKAERFKPVFAAVMLLPLGLYMAASLSYDAALLGCYYLMAAMLFKEKVTERDMGVFLAALVWANMVKPWINLLWLMVPFFIDKNAWQLRRKRARALCAGAGLVGAMVVTQLIEWYGGAFQSNYGTIGRMLGDTVDQMGQLRFVLANPVRYLAVLVGTLYENDFFIGQLGVFASLDMPISCINLLCPVVLVLAAFFSLREKRTLRTRPLWGAAAFSLLYSVGALTAMYITYTPVGMVRIIGFQARYLLPVFLLLAVLLAAALSRVQDAHLTAGGIRRAENTSLALSAGMALLGCVLVFQHFYIGPVYTIG